MGAYVSIPQCAAHYGVTPNCSILPIPDDNNTTPTPLALGDVTRGNFQPDPDIAGIGVLGAFVAVTLLSLLLSICGTVWWLLKYVFRCKSRLTPDEKQKKRGPVSISGILEHLVLSCSDQQVFTGGAYAITLRYAKGCSISAYHYNIVANMLLLTCATHLMAATICRSRRYWEHRLVGVLRIIVTSLVYLVTGILLSNQGSGSDGFPTEVPPADATYSPMLLPAACFQSDASHFTTTVQQSFEGTAGGLLGGGQIFGWVQYLIMLLFYAFAVVVSIGRLLMRAGTRHGKIGKKVRERAMQSDGLKRFWYCLFGLYLVAGNGIAVWTVVKSAWYIIRLRSWVDGSGWLQLSGSGKNPENDPSSFGQLVPMLLMSFTVFTFLQDISDRMKKKAKEHHDKHHPDHRGDHEGNPRDDDGTWVQITNSTPGIGGYDHDGTTPSEGSDKKLGVAITVTEKNDAAPDETPRNGEHMDDANTARLNITPVNYSRGPSRSSSQSNISSSSSSSSNNNGSASSRPQLQAQTRPPATYSLVPKTSMSPIVNGGNSTPPPPPVPSKSSSREFRLTASNTNTASSSSLRQGDGGEHDGNVIGFGLGLDFGTQDDKRSARGVLLWKKSSQHLRG
ncbi:hypothetical protein QBC46DRAFT_288338 [Diplogelasinospora grovesii]|uniref:Uncharacterized protein n=1 Tax=Diplogelasinospora grovesii TaxID=303347 RepID=A0AAN6N9X2_9PEZI|nr:hypothetical protein QBC46DRAFT_288338 [Diplogelasinospora grovesii]